MRNLRKSGGFTLIELLVVISIIGMLSSVILASLSTARSKAQIAAGQQFNSSIYQGRGDQLIGWWSMDECSGSVIGDYSTSNSGGLTANTPTWSTSPNSSGCTLTLNGTSQYILGGVLPNAGPGANVTVTAWIKPTTVTSAVIFSKGALGNCFNYGMSVRSGSLAARNTNGDPVLGGTIRAGQWQHIAVSYNSSGATGYINGTQVGKNSTLTSNCGALTWIIGATAVNSFTSFFNGTVDDVRVYGTSLTADVIRSIYARDMENKPQFATSR